jgi:hypothetical protein
MGKFDPGIWNKPAIALETGTIWNKPAIALETGTLKQFGVSLPLH